MSTLQQWLQHLPLHLVHTGSSGHTNTNTPKILIFIEVNIFLGPEEAMLLALQKLVSS